MNARSSLTEAVSAALSEMAFLDAVERPVGLPPSEPEGQVILTGFTRPHRGHIALRLSLGCRKAVAENVFGSAWGELSPSQIDDCLLELGNVIVGNFLTAYAGTGQAHDVSLPEIRFDPVEPDPRCRVTRATYDVEGHCLDTVLCLET